MCSEENEEPIVVSDQTGGYALVFDPLDGSSNIEANISGKKSNFWISGDDLPRSSKSPATDLCLFQWVPFLEFTKRTSTPRRNLL